MKVSIKNTPRRPMLRVAALTLALALPTIAQAHRAWMLPSSTVLSGNTPWVTVDAAVSNDLFYFEHNALALDGLSIIRPDGSTGEAQNPAKGRYRSTFDVELNQPGTWKFRIASGGLMARYTLDGENKRWRGTAEDFAKAIPEGAGDLQVSESHRRMDVFVTKGAPSDTVLKPEGKGLELVPVTHPNDLFAGEAATFRFLVDGQPMANLKVTVIPGGVRYRNDLKELTLTTDAQGEIRVTWPDAGMYWINTSHEDDKASLPQAKRRLGYSATLEVLAP